MVRHVLVLNGDGLPLQVMPWQDAVSVICERKCTVLEEYEDFPLHSGRGRFVMNCPSVIMIHEFVNPKIEVRFSKYNVFMRDDYSCAYCGDDRGRMTLDHVLPRTRGGISRWENVVTCCERCNTQKGKRSLQEMRGQTCWNGEPFRLAVYPVEPKGKLFSNCGRFVRHVNRSNLAWLQFIPNWANWARRVGKEWLIEAAREAVDESLYEEVMEPESEALQSNI